MHQESATRAPSQRKLVTDTPCDKLTESRRLAKCQDSIHCSCSQCAGRSVKCQRCRVTTVFVEASNECASDFHHHSASTCHMSCGSHSNPSDPESSSADERRSKASASVSCSGHRQMCCGCETTCSTLSDTVVPVVCYSMKRDVDESKPKEIRSLANSLSERLNLHITLQTKVANARKHDLAILRENKKQTLEAMTDAFENAEEQLKHCYEILETKALDRVSAANALHERIRELNERYDAALMSSSDTLPGSVPQLSTFTSSLQALADEGTQLKDPIDPSKLIGNRGCLPADMRRILREWMGQPKLICDDLCCSMEQLSVCDNSSKQVAFPQPLLFSAVKAHVYLKSGFWDLSLTDDDSLLMAAGSAGLIEYNLSGHEERRFIPPGCRNQPGDLVCTVEALSEGRAAVGVRPNGQKCLKDANAVSTSGAQERANSTPQPLVILLRRIGGESERNKEWTEYFRLSGMQGIPVSISAHGDMLAVTTTNGYLELRTVTTDSEKRHGAKHFGYGIQSATVTDRLIVILSNSKVNVKAGSKSVHVVDAFRLEDVRDCLATGLRQSQGVLTSLGASDNQLHAPQWRYKLGRGEQAMDACAADATFSVLYVAVRGRDWSSSSRVTAISTKNGTELWRDVVQCRARLMPYKLSVKECEKRSVMVTLCYDKVTRQCGRTGTIQNSVSS